MKKVTLIWAVVALMMATGLRAQDDNANVSKVAKQVIKAYQTRDVELLKENASGMLKMVLNSTGDSYFKDQEMKDLLNAVDNWDGKIRGIVYETESIMGKTMKMATVYFADGKKNGEIWEVVLMNNGDDNWLAFSEGIIAGSKKEFDEIAKKTGQPEQNSGASSKDISVELANGNKINHASLEKTLEHFNKLNDDNFFIILNNQNNFMQASYSDKGYTVEYKENGTQYEAKDLLSKEKTIELIKDYFTTDGKWKTAVEWEKM